MRFHAYGDPNDISCPKCKSPDIRFITFARRGEEYECPECGLRFWVVWAAVWDEEEGDDAQNTE